MILWTIKLIRSVRRAIAGRKYPSQLAWGVALGTLVGLIPHGNLLAIGLVLLILTLRVNHAMVALTAIGVMFAAPRFDSCFDSLGRWFFEQPQVVTAMTSAWQYPLMPWTNLNNTIVMGSFLCGLAALVPVFLITYPVFRAWAKSAGGTESVVTEKPRKKRRKNKTELKTSALQRVDNAHSAAAPPHVEQPSEPSIAGQIPAPIGTSTITATMERVHDVRRVDGGESEAPTPHLSGAASVTPSTPPVPPVHSLPSSHPPRPTRVAIETPSTVRRSAASGKPVGVRTAIQAKAANDQNKLKDGFDPAGSSADDQHKIDEALSYLLRQLRDSQDKDAA